MKNSHAASNAFMQSANRVASRIALAERSAAVINRGAMSAIPNAATNFKLRRMCDSNDEVERCGDVIRVKRRLTLSQSSTPSLARRRLCPAVARCNATVQASETCMYHGPSTQEAPVQLRIEPDLLAPKINYARE